MAKRRRRRSGGDIEGAGCAETRREQQQHHTGFSLSKGMQHVSTTKLGASKQANFSNIPSQRHRK
jgi:hypothetical protein